MDASEGEEPTYEIKEDEIEDGQVKQKDLFEETLQ